MLQSTELTNGINMALVEQLDNTPAVPVEIKPMIEKVVDVEKAEKDPAEDRDEFIKAEYQKLVKDAIEEYGDPDDTEKMTLQEAADKVAKAHQRGRELKYEFALAMEKGMDKVEAVRKLAEIKHNEGAKLYRQLNKKYQSVFWTYEVYFPTWTKFREIAKFLEDCMEWRTVKVGAPKFDNLRDEDFDKAKLYYYNQDTGLYEKSDKIMEKLVDAVYDDSKINMKKEVIHRIYIDSKNAVSQVSEDYVAFNDCVFSIEDGKRHPYSPDQVILNKLPYNYNPNLTKEPHFKEPGFDDWTLTGWLEDLAKVDGVVDENKLQLLWQILACALHLYSPHLAFWLTDEGEGRSGKGTFQDLVKELAGGTANVGSLRLKDFQEKFRLGDLTKPVIIGDDNPVEEYIKDSSIYRSATTGDTVKVEEKNEKPIDVNPQALIIQSMNGLPKFKDRTPANLRRQRIIKFEHQLTEKEDNPKIKNEYIHDRKLLEWLAQEITRKELAGELDIKNIVDTEESQELRQELQKNSDPVYDFFDQLIHQNNFDSVSFNIDYLRETYLKWSETKEHVPRKIGRIAFTKSLKTAASVLGWESKSKNVPKYMLPGTVRDGHITRNMDISDLNRMYHCKPGEEDPLENGNLNDRDLDNRNKAIVYNPKAFE